MGYTLLNRHFILYMYVADTWWCANIHFQYFHNICSGNEVRLTWSMKMAKFSTRGAFILPFDVLYYVSFIGLSKCTIFLEFYWCGYKVVLTSQNHGLIQRVVGFAQMWSWLIFPTHQSRRSNRFLVESVSSTIGIESHTTHWFYHERLWPSGNFVVPNASKYYYFK